jgi:hypothetical protein
VREVKFDDSIPSPGRRFDVHLLFVRLGTISQGTPAAGTSYTRRPWTKALTFVDAEVSILAETPEFRIPLGINFREGPAGRDNREREIAGTARYVKS